jgi:hypothetical protein
VTAALVFKGFHVGARVLALGSAVDRLVDRLSS